VEPARNPSPRNVSHYPFMNKKNRKHEHALVSCREIIAAQDLLACFIQDRCEPFEMVCPHASLTEGLPSVHVYDLARAKIVFGADGWVDDAEYKVSCKTVDGVSVSADFASSPPPGKESFFTVTM